MPETAGGGALGSFNCSCIYIGSSMTRIGVIQNTVASTPWDNKEESVSQILARLANAGYEGLELSNNGLEGLDADEFKRQLDAAGLEAVAIRFYDDKDMEEAAELGRTLGTNNLVGGHTGDDVTTTEEFEAVCKDLAALADRAQRHGLQLHVHNHTEELNEIDDGRSLLVALKEEIDNIEFELDVGHVVRAGEDPVEVLRQLTGRVSLVHFTDVDTDAPEQPNVEIGEGNLDVQACFEAARDAGTDWFIHEYNQTTDPHRTIERSGEILTGL